MRSHHGLRMLLGGLLLLGLTSMACSQAKMSQEMREQESEMMEESRRWADEVTQWSGVHQEMHAWHTSHPGIPADTTELRHHQEKMTQHEQDVANFSRDLEAHRAKLQEEAALPESKRVAAHAALWANHLKLKAAYELTEAAHKDLVEEHAKYTTAATTPQ